MASLNSLAAAITTTFLITSTLALPSTNINQETPPLSSYPDLPPDVAPLFPSSGGAAYPPAGSAMPTIPSTRSPPNPITGSTGLGTAFGPSSPLQDSSARDQVLVKVLGFDGVVLGFLSFWLVLGFFV